MSPLVDVILIIVRANKPIKMKINKLIIISAQIPIQARAGYLYFFNCPKQPLIDTYIQEVQIN